jgi:hypothetical protein
MTAHLPLPTVKIDLNHPCPWTEAEFHALDETASRVELIDGVLLVGQQGWMPHQYLPAGMVHLGPGRPVTPDITVADVVKSVPTRCVS